MSRNLILTNKNMFKVQDIIKPKKEEKPAFEATRELSTQADIAKETQASKKSIEETKMYQQGVVSVLDLISPAAFEVKPSFVKIGSLYARTLFVLTYPRYVSVGWFAPIINYNASLDVGMFFYPMKSEIVLKQLRTKVGILQAGWRPTLKRACRAIRCAKPRLMILKCCAMT